MASSSLLSNVTNVTTELASSSRDEKLASIEIGTLSFILLLAVTSNLTMLIAIWRQRRNRPLSRMYFFMMHLSLADLLVALFNILPQLAWDITYRFHGGDVLCRFVKYTQIMTLYLSTYILMFMAVDRYRAVCCRNLHWNSLKVAKCFVAASWVMSMLFAIPQAVIFHEEEISVGVTDCWVQFAEPWGAKAYVTWFVVSIFGAPLLVVAVCYGVICRQIWIYSQSAQPSLLPSDNSAIPSHSSITETGSTLSVMRRWFLRAGMRWQKSRNSSNAIKNNSATASQLSDTIPMRSLATQQASNPLSTENKISPMLPQPPPAAPQRCQQMSLRRSNSNQNRITKAKMKTIKLTLAVVLCFVACWAPFCITQLIMVYCPPTSQADVSPVAVIILLLASLNSCSNPWIYLAFSGSLLNQMRVCLGLRWLRGQDKDSIGEDDRRGAAGPAGGQPADTNHRFGRGPRRAQTRDQHRQVMAEQQLLPAGEQHPAMLATKCTRADIVTHLGNTKKLQFQQNHQHVEKIG
ncbi:oxytocin receptor isoform X1 [Daphnia magna]|uniref:oxytocin receptor isoform X1 n=1 Tax=Daphnia magna TaxID=35525 RepID=UPI001E1BBBE8|nr:oxytocin receptor isoform X1 [Daphnia magna]XP_032788670.2 oxytocin receptor isoform X1 [Daphnia magna]